jgi:hypothetical protein
MIMTSLPPPLCLTCVHYGRPPVGGLPCKAFPKGIPDDILSSKVIHTAPYPGDHGIRYQPVNERS